jgi:photosystem II P680 reaction center D1 protein
MHPFRMLGVTGVFGGFLVTSFLSRETAKNGLANYGHRVAQEHETYNIVDAHCYFSRLIFQYASLNNFF